MESTKNLVLLLMIGLCSFCLLPGCGGGSSGTGTGPSPTDSYVEFSGLVLSPNGREIESATVTLLNTEEQVNTDESGSFDMRAKFPGGDATFSIVASNGSEAIVVVDSVKPGQEAIELSIIYNPATNSASLLDTTLRARIVRTCSPQFLNTRTIRQMGAVPESFVCTVETEIKSDGAPIDGLDFELQYRGCAKNDPWIPLARGKSGSSGPGLGEIDFPFKNDKEHCVYRILGAEISKDLPRLSAQIHTLFKQEFDQERTNEE